MVNHNRIHILPQGQVLAIVSLAHKFQKLRKIHQTIVNSLTDLKLPINLTITLIHHITNHKQRQHLQQQTGPHLQTTITIMACRLNPWVRTVSRES